MALNPLNVTIVLIIGLVGVGVYGLLVSRNLIRAVIGLQIMVKAAMLGLLLAGKLAGKPSIGQSMAITVIVSDTIVAVIALALSVQIRNVCGTLDVRALTRLKR